MASPYQQYEAASQYYQQQPAAGAGYAFAASPPSLPSPGSQHSHLPPGAAKPASPGSIFAGAHQASVQAPIANLYSSSSVATVPHSQVLAGSPATSPSPPFSAASQSSYPPAGAMGHPQARISSVSSRSGEMALATGITPYNQFGQLSPDAAQMRQSHSRHYATGSLSGAMPAGAGYPAQSMTSPPMPNPHSSIEGHTAANGSPPYRSPITSPPLAASPVSGNGSGSTSFNPAGDMVQSSKTKRSRASALTRETGLSVATISSRKREKLLPNRWAGAWMIAIFVESAICIVMAALAFGYIQARTDHKVQDLKTMSVYLVLLVVGMFFQFLIALDAVRLKNTLQVIGVLVFNIALCVAAALEIPQVRDALDAQDRFGDGVKCRAADSFAGCRALATLEPKVRSFLIVVPAVIGIAEFVLASIAFRLWQEFAWSIYTNIGADRTLRNRYLVYQLYVVFLKLCFIFGIFFTVAYLILIADERDWAYGVTIAAIPIAVLVLVLSAFAARKEEPFLMGSSLIMLVTGLTYFVWKLSRIYMPDSEQDYRYVRLSLTFMSCFAIGTLLCTIVIGIFVFANFGKGLRVAHESIGMFNFVRTTRHVSAHAHAKSQSRASLAGGSPDEMASVMVENVAGSNIRRQSASILSPPMAASRLSLD